VGHLVYAKGNEPSRTHNVDGADVTLRAYALDLSLPPEELVATVDTLAATIACAADASSTGQGTTVDADFLDHSTISN
jgi:hypothetical protein